MRTGFLWLMASLGMCPAIGLGCDETSTSPVSAGRSPVGTCTTDPSAKRQDSWSLGGPGVGGSLWGRESSSEMSLCIEAADGTVLATIPIDTREGDGVASQTCSLDGIAAPNVFEIGRVNDDEFTPSRAYVFDLERNTLVEVPLARVSCIYLG